MKTLKVLPIVLTMVGLLLTSSTFGYGSCDPEPAKSCEPVKTCDCQPCGCDAPMGPNASAYNHPARVDVCSSWDFFLTGSFLYWQLLQEQMEIAETNFGLDLINSKVFIQDFDYKPAFKVGLGMNMEYDNWSAYVQYTRLNSSMSTTVNIGSATNLRNLSYSATLNSTTQVKVKWDLDHNIFDFELGRPSYNGKHLTLSPHFGLKGGWIDQKIKTDDFGTLIYINNDKSDSWLIGPRAGIYTNWTFFEGFRFMGNAAASLFYQKFNNVTIDGINNDGTVNKKITYESGFINPSLEFLLGLGWGSYFYENNYFFDLSVAYETQVYFNQNMWRHLVELDSGAGYTKPGNLMFQGLNVTARIDF